MICWVVRANDKQIPNSLSRIHTNEIGIIGMNFHVNCPLGGAYVTYLFKYYRNQYNAK